MAEPVVDRLESVEIERACALVGERGGQRDQAGGQQPRRATGRMHRRRQDRGHQVEQVIWRLVTAGQPLDAR
jgi:hypothetical protein